MEESKLRLYSLGIVVEDKPENTDIILVSPIEVLNIQESGEIKTKEKTYKGTLKNIDSNNFNTEISSKNYFRAKWLPFSQSNRITAPNVVEGETVILFKYGDIDEYYWSTIFREPILRRQETVNYSFSNLKSEKGKKAFDKKTSYWLEISTKHKYIKLHTANNDNEHTTYDITIDTKSGFIDIKDGKGNLITLDSSKNKLNINTNSSIDVTTRNLNIKADNSVNITTPVLNLTGNLEVKGNIHATGTIIDDSGNTNHHSH